MRNKLLYTMVIAVFLLVIPSCWDVRDIDLRTFILAMGVDLTPENQLSLTTQSVVARNLPWAGGGSENGGGSGTVAINTSTGTTLIEALREQGKTTNRLLELGHNKVVVIGEDLARQGIERILEVLIRTGGIDNSLWLAVSRGPAKDIIAAEPKEEAIPAIFIENLFSQGGDRPSVYPRVHLWEAYTHYLSPARQMFLPVVWAEADKIHTEGIAIFKEHQLVGWLDGQETQIFLWLTNRVTTGDFIIPEFGENQFPIHVRVKSARGKFAVDTSSGAPQLTAKLDINGIIQEVGEIQLHSVEDLAVLEKQSEIILSEKLRAMLTATQTVNSDIVGFENYIRRHYPKLWKELDWDSSFPQAPIKVTVNVRLNVTWPNI